MEQNVLKLHYKVDNKDFSLAGEASSNLKTVLRKLGVNHEIIRKVSIAMYEGEINMFIHANGGAADIEITPSHVKVILSDNGPGIPDIDLAMREGYSTAADCYRELGFGAGMGLPNMRNYADDLKISSQIGKGTTVEIRVDIK